MRDAVLSRLKKDSTPRGEEPTKTSKTISVVFDGSPSPIPESKNEETQIPPTEPEKEPLPESVSWESPLFGRLEAGPVLEQGPDTFSLRHPLTQEIVELPNEWLDSLDERAAILEFDAGLPREAADKQAKIEFFQLFRKGGDRP